MSKKTKQIVCIMGPTASGKTKLAIELVRRFPFEIISVDSAMVYRDMNIGTAKPSVREMISTPHHLINILDPAENYSAGRFCLDAEKIIKDIFAKNKIPLLIGGTMLYFNLFQRGFTQFPSHSPEIRYKIDYHAKTLGWAQMHKRLELIDSKAASHIHPNDSQRIQRALEIYEMTGQTMSDLQAQQVWREHPYDVINIVLEPADRSKLHARIEMRFDEMIKQGLVEEVRALHSRCDLDSTMPSMRMLNYRQVYSYLQGECDQARMRELAIFATRQYAKRQLTWLRRWEDALRFDCNDDALEQRISSALIANLSH